MLHHTDLLLKPVIGRQFAAASVGVTEIALASAAADVAADGVILAKRAAFKCTHCSEVVWQEPHDFIRARAWPACMSVSHLR